MSRGRKVYKVKYFKTSIESFSEIKGAILIIKNLTSTLGGVFAEPGEQ